MLLCREEWMRIKQGFISNSSSTSFVLSKDSGPWFDITLLQSIVDLINIATEKDCVRLKAYTGNPYGDWNDYYSFLNLINPTELIMCIESIDDNSIPFDVQEWIERTIQCKYIHLG